MPKRRRTSRRAPRRSSRSIGLIGAILLLVSPFVPSIAIGTYVPRGAIFPVFGGGLVWPWFDIWGILALIMGVLALIGLLIDAGDVTLILCVIAGIIGLIVGLIALIGFLGMSIIFAFAPATALLGGLLTLLGALRIRM